MPTITIKIKLETINIFRALEGIVYMMTESREDLQEKKLACFEGGGLAFFSAVIFTIFAEPTFDYSKFVVITIWVLWGVGFVALGVYYTMKLKTIDIQETESQTRAQEEYYDPYRVAQRQRNRAIEMADDEIRERRLELI